MRKEKRNWTPPRRAYLALILLRCFMAICGPGYIHPDEFFQNGEITAREALGLYTLRTWEWNSEFPCRSIVPPFLTTGVVFKLLSVVTAGQPTHPRLLFVAERISFLLLSFILDYAICCLISFERDRWTALMILASSYVMHTFAVRPFSNAVEAALLALAFVVTRSLVGRPRTSVDTSLQQGQLSTLAIIFVFGVFTRLTFVAFALAIAWQILTWTVHEAQSDIRHSWSYAWARLIAVPALVAVVTASCFISIDSTYFQVDLSWSSVTPLNFLRYNMSAQNLAEHGIHPRWLHVIVNLPIIVGPGLLYYGMMAAYKGFNHSNIPSRTQQSNPEWTKNMSIYIVVSSLVILSLQPHQEPRFLVPLIIPSIVLAVQDGSMERAGKLFWRTWIISNFALALLFGVLHQGGVVPSLFYIHDELATIRASLGVPSQNVQIFYWKTYMAPRHLLGITEDDVNAGSVSLTDLSGSPFSTLNDALWSPSSAVANRITFLVTPLHSMKAVDAPRRECFSMRKQVFPHLDLDHLAESLALGWMDGMSLGIYSVDSACIRRRQNYTETG